MCLILCPPQDPIRRDSKETLALPPINGAVAVSRCVSRTTRDPPIDLKRRQAGEFAGAQGVARTSAKAAASPRQRGRCDLSGHARCPMPRPRRNSGGRPQYRDHARAVADTVFKGSEEGRQWRSCLQSARMRCRQGGQSASGEAASEQIDYEAELAVSSAAKVKYVSKRARITVWGYTIVNEVYGATYRCGTCSGIGQSSTLSARWAMVVDATARRARHTSAAWGDGERDRKRVRASDLCYSHADRDDLARLTLYPAREGATVRTPASAWVCSRKRGSKPGDTVRSDDGSAFSKIRR